MPDRTITWVLEASGSDLPGGPPALAEVARSRGHHVLALEAPKNDAGWSAVGCGLETAENPVILRGTHAFVTAGERVLNAVPGGFRHPTAFQPAVVARALGSLCVNAGGVELAYGDFLALHRRDPDNRFVKPAREAKRFNGLVVTPRDAEIGDAHFRRFGFWDPVPVDELVFMAPVVPVGREWRVVIVAGQPVSYQIYRQPGGTLDEQTALPDTVEAAAKAAAMLYRPALAFVLDIAEPRDCGAPGLVVEANAFGTSGLRDCDSTAIVRALEAHL